MATDKKPSDTHTKIPAKRPHAKPLSLYPLTFEEAVGILAPPIRAPEAPAPPDTTPPAQNPAHTRTRMSKRSRLKAPKARKR